ncbi:MAG: thioredoxin domain-containing protein [Cryomorphaceae bacterium]|nr:thioredoxin domain-containing protein [Cryomorphaceae bacterium]
MSAINSLTLPIDFFTMNNELHLSPSLYLQQHKDNPVHWKQWGNSIWKEAERKDKLVIVSIGYSSCHWCHVMEHECFEQDDVADVMNAHFISIKVDREERPDIDHIYMTAVQLMSGQGGWPLNVVCLPDKRPIWGATYVPRDKWMQTLLQIQKLYKQEPEKVRQYAAELQEGLQATELLPQAQDSDAKLNTDWLKERESRVLQMRDREWGGYNRAPKFPMPWEQIFHLMSAEAFHLPDMEAHMLNTLHKMKDGGIYDVLGGGFCRYAVDGRWKVPHFEKMLYDNAQLLNLFSMASRRTNNREFREVLYGIKRMLQSDFLNANGLYASAIDADSEGEEGKYYTWTKAELKAIARDDYPILEAVYDLQEPWEERYILFRLKDNQSAAKNLELSVDDMELALENVHQKLLAERKKRVAPAIDRKSIAGWNGLLITGFVHAYLATGEANWKTLAEDLANSAVANFKKDGQWHRINSEGKVYNHAQLEDMAALSQGFLMLFSVTGNDQWFVEAEALVELAMSKFSDDDSPFFFTTASDSEHVIQRSRDLEDNVIPSPNALMADALRLYCAVSYQPELEARWKAMVKHAGVISREVKSGFYLWGVLYLQMAADKHKAWVISGDNSASLLTDITQTFHDFHTDLFVLIETSNHQHGLFQGRWQEKTRHFVCQGKHCHAPVETVEEAIDLCRQ